MSTEEINATEESESSINIFALFGAVGKTLKITIRLQ